MSRLWILTSIADETSYINYIKPLILAHELEIPHVLSVIDTKDEWFYRIHPERMVPSLKDQDPETKAEVIVFESTACLQYLADRFDDGTWTGRNAAERGSVLSWTAYQTAALGYIPGAFPRIRVPWCPELIVHSEQADGKILALLPPGISDTPKPRSAATNDTEVWLEWDC